LSHYRRPCPLVDLARSMYGKVRYFTFCWWCASKTSPGCSGMRSKKCPPAAQSSCAQWEGLSIQWRGANRNLHAKAWHTRCTLGTQKRRELDYDTHNDSSNTPIPDDAAAERPLLSSPFKLYQLQKHHLHSIISASDGHLCSPYFPPMLSIHPMTSDPRYHLHHRYHPRTSCPTLIYTNPVLHRAYFPYNFSGIKNVVVDQRYSDG